MKTENKIDKYLNDSTFGYEDSVNDDVKGLHKWLIDFEKAYDNGNKPLSKSILKNIKTQVDKILKIL